MPLRLTAFLLLSLTATLAQAQSGGLSTYKFLKLNSSARVAALGGKVVSLRDNDLQLVSQNPALLDSNAHGQVSLSYINYVADVNYGHLAFAKHYKDLGTFSLGLQSVGYGKFIAAEENADITGDFRAGEYALVLQGARPISKNLTAGASFKLIYSNLAQYNSFGTAIDASCYYVNEHISAGLSIRDAGIQLKKYDQEREPLPFSIDAGISGKLQKAPIRFTLTVSDLQRWDLTYSRDSVETNTVPVLGPDGKAKNTFLAKAVSHISGGVELLLGKSFYVSGGYNYLRRQELKLPTRPGLSGFSAGFGFRIYKFRLSYAFTAFNPASHANMLTVVMRPSDFLSRK